MTYEATEVNALVWNGTAWELAEGHTARDLQVFSYVGRLLPNQWYHCVWVMQDGTSKFYVDGVAAGTSSTSGNINTGGMTITIGTDHTHADDVPVDIAGLALYSGELSAARVAAHYAGAWYATPTYETEVLTDSPLAYYRCDDTDGTMVDSSGNGRNGTWVGTVTNVSSPIGNGRTVTGTSVCGTIADGAWMDVTAITVEAFCRWPDTSSATGTIQRRSSPASYSLNSWHVGASFDPEQLNSRYFPGSSAISSTSEIATATWTKPTSVVGYDSVLVVCVGGGGGGGGGKQTGGGTRSNGGSGGGSGGVSIGQFAIADMPATATVTPGEKGAAGTSGSSPTSGGTGGTTTFSVETATPTVITAYGGEGGPAGGELSTAQQRGGEGGDGNFRKGYTGGWLSFDGDQSNVLIEHDPGYSAGGSGGPATSLGTTYAWDGQAGGDAKNDATITGGTAGITEAPTTYDGTDGGAGEDVPTPTSIALTSDTHPFTDLFVLGGGGGGGAGVRSSSTIARAGGAGGWPGGGGGGAGSCRNSGTSGTPRDAGRGGGGAVYVICF